MAFAGPYFRIMQVDAEGLPVGGDQPERAERPEALIEAAARLVDLRGVARPPTFSGFTKDWSEFRFRMESVTSLLGLEVLMAKAATTKIEDLTPREQVGSRFLYNLLVQLCHGEALAIIRLVPHASGLHAWRRLVEEYEPEEAARYCAVLSSLLMPEWKEDLPLQQFMEQLLAWERRVIEYEAAIGAPMPDTYKCAVVMRRALRMVRGFLRGYAEDLTGDFQKLKRASRLQGPRPDLRSWRPSHSRRSSRRSSRANADGAGRPDEHGQEWRQRSRRRCDRRTRTRRQGRWQRTGGAATCWARTRRR